MTPSISVATRPSPRGIEGTIYERLSQEVVPTGRCGTPDAHCGLSTWAKPRIGTYGQSQERNQSCGHPCRGHAAHRAGAPSEAAKNRTIARPATGTATFEHKPRTPVEKDQITRAGSHGGVKIRPGLRRRLHPRTSLAYVGRGLTKNRVETISVRFSTMTLSALAHIRRVAGSGS